jgi:hypothetical protein
MTSHDPKPAAPARGSLDREHTRELELKARARAQAPLLVSRARTRAGIDIDQYHEKNLEIEFENVCKSDKNWTSQNGNERVEICICVQPAAFRVCALLVWISRRWSCLFDLA